MNDTEILTEQKIADNSLGTLRKIMFEQMLSLRSGETDAQEAIAMSKMAHQITQSYKVEIEAVKVANELKDRNVKLQGNIKALSWLLTKTAI